MTTLPLTAFRELHLLSSWKALDKPSGTVYMHEVRRDRSTGLTLKAKWPCNPTATRRTTNV